jgi:hypothetical protein
MESPAFCPPEPPEPSEPLIFQIKQNECSPASTTVPVSIGRRGMHVQSPMQDRSFDSNDHAQPPQGPGLQPITFLAIGTVFVLLQIIALAHVLNSAGNADRMCGL